MHIRISHFSVPFLVGSQNSQYANLIEGCEAVPHFAQKKAALNQKQLAHSHSHTFRVSVRNNYTLPLLLCNMPKGALKIEYIEDKKKRYSAFSKRKAGLITVSVNWCSISPKRIVVVPTEVNFILGMSSI